METTSNTVLLARACMPEGVGVARDRIRVMVIPGAVPDSTQLDYSTNGLLESAPLLFKVDGSWT